MKYPDELPVFEVVYRLYSDRVGEVGDHVEGTLIDTDGVGVGIAVYPVDMEYRSFSNYDAWFIGYGTFGRIARHELKPLTPAAEAMLKVLS